ncbi:hypothetical protein TBLA_0D01130 [Henningerozyma blattae CBS 6284]|uniref:BRO1 domain-containing protein n=1 Tax=Henningerozyma blattae (strain ATCC 34711 / CBS 6284 / DSM 70876 / NBRC 10599 / NRRL Y-10934 / UCD 77-7) TaxID=1071380 RepID=I2H2L9_HENB6|nr:hypothetical protein TBLA_0D01130 [Tetrapisispora blattae CBS 6284]CCH60621.1 hypothetical protein TBLA_0D01130 [Tetrapisispora blattae CBS 6284]
MAEFLRIPLNEKIYKNDLKDQLFNVLSSSVQRNPQKLDNDINSFVNVERTLENLTISNNSLNALKLYYVQLSNLENVVPDDKIQFNWRLALPSLELDASFESLLLEKCLILYNIGAIYMGLGVDSYVVEIPVVKEVCQYFQAAAGCFSQILENIKELRHNHNIFNPSFLKCLINLALAEAQECSWFISKQCGHSDSVLSKLSYQIALYYEEALREYILMNFKENWIKDIDDYLQFKTNYFVAAATYRKGIYLSSKNKFGLAIANLKYTEYLLNKIKKTRHREKIINFQTTSNDRLNNELRDNESLHLQEIPTLQSPNINPANMVSPQYVGTIIQKDLIKGDINTFTDLIPISVIESSNAYREKQEKYVNEELIKPLKEIKNNLEIFVNTDIQLHLARTIQQSEVASCKESFKEMSQLETNTKSIIDRLISSFTKEQEINEKYENKYGYLNWNNLSHSPENDYIREKISFVNEYIKEGQLVTQQTKQLYKSLDLRTILEPTTGSKEFVLLFQRFTMINNYRSTFLRNIKLKSENNPILPKLIKTYSTEGISLFPQVFNDHLKLFENDRKEILDEEVKNIEYKHHLQKLEPQTTQITKSILDSNPERYKAIEQFANVKLNIMHGIKFYEDLLMSVNDLQDRINVFLNQNKNKRTQEATRLGIVL